MSLRKAENAKCRDCTYDPCARGTWLQQVSLCSVLRCPLWPVRPVTRSPIPEATLAYCGLAKDPNRPLWSAKVTKLAQETGDQVPAILPEPFLSSIGLEKLAANEPPETSLLGCFRTSQTGFIAAPPAAGKSLFALKLAIAISLGDDFGPWEGDGEIKQAVIVDAELTAQALHQRIKLLCGDRVPMMIVDTYVNRLALGMEPFMLGNPDHQAQLMRAASNAKVVVIDNVTFTLDPAPGKNLFAPETINQLRPLISWARNNGTLLIFIDHTNYEGNLAGSANKSRIADWVAMLEPDVRADDVSIAFTLKFTKYRGDDGPRREVAFQMTNAGEWSHREIVSLPEQVKELHEMGVSTQDIAAELGVTPQSVNRIKRKFNA